MIHVSGKTEPEVVQSKVHLEVCAMDLTAQFPKESLFPNRHVKSKNQTPSTKANAQKHNASPCKSDNEREHPKPRNGKQNYQVLNMWIFVKGKHLARVGPDNDVVVIRVKLLTAGDEEASNMVAAVI